MRVDMGSFGATLTSKLTVPDFTWTKIAFDETQWDTSGHFDLSTGCLTTERAGKYHFVAGARLLISTNTCCSVDLILYKNGEALRDLTRHFPLTKNYYSVPLDTRRKQRVQFVRGFTTREVVAGAGDVFEVYIRQDCGDRAYLTPYLPDAPDGTDLMERHPTFFLGAWHA